MNENDTILRPGEMDPFKDGCPVCGGKEHVINYVKDMKYATCKACGCVGTPVADWEGDKEAEDRLRRHMEDV